MSPLDVSKYLGVSADVSDSREQRCGVIIYRSIIFLFVALNLLSLGLDSGSSLVHINPGGSSVNPSNSKIKHKIMLYTVYIHIPLSSEVKLWTTTGCVSLWRGSRGSTLTVLMLLLGEERRGLFCSATPLILGGVVRLCNSLGVLGWHLSVSLCFYFFSLFFLSFSLLYRLFAI